MKEMFILLYLIIIGFNNGNYMSINFYKYKHRSSYNIDNIFFSIMATDISIGNPEYKISLQISTDTPYSLVKGSNSPKEYNQDKSSSFDFIK